MENRTFFILLFLILSLFLNVGICYNKLEDIYQKDTTVPQINIKNVNPGGIFFSPGIGVEIPFLKFANNSNMALSIGGRFEYSSLKLYPFVIGASYYYQNHSGSDVYKTKNLLNSLKTKIHNVGIGCDIILNKYLKQTFTIIFATVEMKYLKISREISPDNVVLDIKKEDSVFGVSGGLGFTLYIFDIYGTYTYAKDYSNFSIKTRVRFPVLRF